MGAQKGISKANEDLFLIVMKFRVLKNRFLVFSLGPGGFRELREAYRNHFHRSWYLSDAVVTSYGKKPFLGGIFLPSTVSYSIELVFIRCPFRTR